MVTDLTAKTITLDRSLDVAVSVANKVRVAPAWAMVKAYGKTHLELKDFAVDCNRDKVARAFGSGKYSHHPGPEPVKPEGYTCPFPQLLAKVKHAEELTSAIYMYSAHHSRFTNLNLYNIPMSGIFLIESDYILVQGNTIRDFGLKSYVYCFGDHARIIGNLIQTSMHE